METLPVQREASTSLVAQSDRYEHYGPEINQNKAQSHKIHERRRRWMSQQGNGLNSQAWPPGMTITWHGFELFGSRLP